MGITWILAQHSENLRTGINLRYLAEKSNVWLVRAHFPIAKDESIKVSNQGWPSRMKNTHEH
jgi:hypothetical protein